jgi:hypothetical protein
MREHRQELVLLPIRFFELLPLTFQCFLRLATPGDIRRPGGMCAIPNGSRTLNVVPTPGSLVASIEPPWSFTSSCTSARPMPEPSCVRACVPSTR